MSDRRDLELVLESGTPLIVIETTDETRVLELLREIALARSASSYRPLFRWSITDGLQRLDLDLEAQRHNADPEEALRHIRATGKPGVFALLDFHPFFKEPVHIRLLKDIALAADNAKITLLLIGHRLEIPQELMGFTARFSLRLPDVGDRRAIIERCADEYLNETGRRVKVDPAALELLIRNLSGLTMADTERLGRNAIRDDGAVTASDLPAVMKAKYELLNRGGVLSFEYDTTRLSELAGFRTLKQWLAQRTWAFRPNPPAGLEPPKGILLLGVQGCGKSLAAKATAGAFGVPLLRLDFGSLYNKFHGETERNLRESLQTAEVLSPCVLWLDEIEKGLATGNDDSGTARRILGGLLTWMAERRAQVFMVATANEVSELPPELVRKGRFDEIFFVDLPPPPSRAEILTIHLRKRGLAPGRMNLAELVALTDGFSGAEIEQGIVSSLYAAHALDQAPEQAHVAAELRKTRPLSVVMAERVAALRAWASGRTVPAE
jgi:ATPase family protein associated with various cellular activities (AAA)